MVESETSDASAAEEGAERAHSELRHCAVLGRNPAAAGAVRRWWRHMCLTQIEADQHESGIRTWSPGLRAALRRCETPEAAVLSEGFRRLYEMQRNTNDGVLSIGEIADWACVGMVLAGIRSDVSQVSFASAAGREKADSGEPIVSALRFQQLQDSRTPEELVRRLRRVLQMLRETSISVVLLADDVLLWAAERRRRRWPDEPGKRLAFRWAQAYFDEVARYKPVAR